MRKISDIRAGSRFSSVHFHFISAAFHLLIGTSLILAFLGQLTQGAVLLIALATVILFHIHTTHPSTSAPRQHERATFKAYTLALLVFACFILYVAYLVMGVDYQYQLARDGGIYSTTAMNLNTSGTLRPALDSLFHLRNTLRGTSAINVEAGHIEFQGSHGASVAYALASFVVGIRWMVVAAWVAAALTAGHLYRILRAFGCRREIAWSAIAALFLGLPMIENLRSTYSEIFLLAAISASVDILTTRVFRDQEEASVLCGFCLGISTIYRADAPLFVGLVLIGLAITPSPYVSERSLRYLALSALPGVVLGWLDLRFWSTEYAADLGNQYRNVVAVSAFGFVTVFLSIVARRVLSNRGCFEEYIRGNLGPLRRIQGALPWLSAGTMLMLVVGGLLAPVAFEAAGSGSNSYVAAIEQREGIKGDGSRTYDEFNLQSVAWYWGPMWFVLLPASFAWVTFRLASIGRRFWAIGLGLGSWIFFYVPDNRITPDHLFATRRWIPGFFPFSLIAGALLLSALVSRFRSRHLAVLGLALSTALVSPSLVGAFHFRNAKIEYGAYEMLREMCSTLPESADLVLTPDVRLMTPTLRYGCNVEAAWLEDVVPLAVVQRPVTLPHPPRSSESFILVTTSSDPAVLFPRLEVIRAWQVTGDVADGHFTTLSRPVREVRPNRAFSISFFELKIPNDVQNLEPGMALVLEKL